MSSIIILIEVKMMRPYFFLFKVIPHQDNPHYQEISGAYATVCVVDSTMEEAKKKSLRYISAYLWILEKVEYELEPTPEQIARCDVVIQALLRKDQRVGLSAYFVGGRRIEGSPDDPVEIVIDPPLFPPKVWE
jgi:hypothetical protein